MENSLERLEQIMKPYFDKKEEIERLSTLNENEVEKFKNELADSKDKREKEIAKLELRLARLRENRDREIEEYVASQPSFYAGYAATLRKDLEQAYKAQEDELTTEIMNLVFNEKEMNSEQTINSINSRPNYNKVYLKEMIEVKDSLRKSLIAEQREITFALQREKINFDSVMQELSNFKYQYNDQHQVINGLAWKELYEKSNEISIKMNELRNSLKVVEEYLNLTELTKEEIAAGMSSLTPWEKAEYDRRNAINKQELPETKKAEEELPIIQELDEFDKSNADDPSEVLEQMEEIQKDIEEDDKIEEVNSSNIPEDLVDSYTPVRTFYTTNETDTIVQKLDDLSNVIYKDLLDLVDGMNSIKIDNSSNSKTNYFSEKSKGEENYNYVGKINDQEILRLPTGEFLKQDEIRPAIDKFYKKNKRFNFIVKDQDKDYKVSKSQIRKLKKALKECVAIELVQKEKLSDLDVKDVLYKNRQETLDNSTKVGTVSTNLPEGIYISRDEFKDKLKEVFVSKEKRLEWLKKLSTKFKSLGKNDLDKDNEVELDSMIQDEQQETIKQR